MTELPDFRACLHLKPFGGRWSNNLPLAGHPYAHFLRLKFLDKQSMTSASTIIQSQTAHEDATAFPGLEIFPRRIFRQKIALTIPTLCEAGNLPVLLDRARGVLDPLNFD